MDASAAGHTEISSRQAQPGALAKARRLLKFLPDQPAYEAEFSARYREDAPHLLAVGAALAMLIFGAFWLLDVLTLDKPMLGGLQAYRIAIVPVLGALLALAHFRPALVVRHYTVIMNLLLGLGMQFAVLVAYESRKDASLPELYWAVNSSAATAAIVAAGVSKLHAWNTLLLTAAGIASAIAYTHAMPFSADPQDLRLSVHLATITLVCYGLRRALEARAIELFLRGKEQQLAAESHARSLEQAKHLVEVSDRAKMQFLANMSHELRTPMHGLQQVLELVRQKAGKDEEGLLDAGIKSAGALLQTLNGILNYTALSKGHHQLAREPLDLRKIADGVDALFQALARGKGLGLRVSANLPPGCPHVIGDRVKLQEVCNNLVANALKFTQEGGVEVRLEASRADDEVRLSLVVADTGIGLSPEQLAKVGTPFWQADSSLSRRIGGTGLGVAGCLKNVQLMGGSLTFDSAPGQGTTATIELRLPASHAAPPPGAAAETAHEPEPSIPTAWSATRTMFQGDILLAEDNPLNALLASTQLSQLGFTVEIASDGDAAVEAFKRRAFDLVLMDVQMPTVDGLEATRKIRAFEAQLPTDHRTPIIAWTAHPSGTDQDHCENAGMDAFLEKPLERAQLVRVLAQWITRAPA